MANLVEQIRRPMLRRLHAYWDERRGPREFPGRPDIDPIDMHFALGHISLIDVLHAPLRFRCRLHGSIIAAWIGMDMTGKFVDEIPETGRRGFVEDDFRAVVETRLPLARRGDENRDEGHWNFDSIVLPLGLADGVINMLLHCVDYHTD